MKTHVICEKFYTGSKLIDRPVNPDLWEEARAIARTRMLSGVSNKRAYYARPATAEEVTRAEEIEVRRLENADGWVRVG